MTETVMIMDSEKFLIVETQKWLKKIEALNIEAKTDKGKEHKANIEAYIKDSKYFLEKKDYVRAFEAVIWAWAFLEISKDLELVSVQKI
jgi:uncharacterized protein